MKYFIVLCLVSVTLAEEKSACQLHRERELAKEAIPGRLVPECEEDGSYKAMQCHSGGSRFCQCWGEDGTILTAPSTRLTACKCIREKATAEERGKHMVGVFVPDCEPDGTYLKKQCWPSTGHCWCADKDGNKVTEPTRSGVQCE
uniref:Venom toxin n=1 Tax=Hemiscorpius lepturus TaxID=520031 RepID=A0A1L4BJA7_HEMLE|nr:venom toxin [Hemiscorpius lepturus]